ncbi:MAG: acetate--CoA ligase family protein [Sheuella sp.]|nr:acetate--CoA ligase family protein [Sheuella sp.]
MSDLLESALNPRTVAIIGASENIHKIGGRPIYYMQRAGFSGTIYPVNPTREEVQGLKSYPSLASLPEVPELVLIVVAGEKALEAVEECAATGVKSVVVIASGFGEVDDAGRAVQQRMTDAARATGMRIYGPNTHGLANFGTGVIAGFSTMFIECPPQDGPIAVLSQSGGMSAMVYGLLRQKGLGVRHVHATGNEADVTVSEMAWAVAHDPEIKLILLYLENIANPEMLARTAEYARSRDLPIVAVKAGRCASGQQAASTHTGSMANEDRVVDAFFKKHGIWRVRDPHAQALAAEAYLKGWRPAGNKLVVISNSGASCVMGADAAEDNGLEMAKLSASTQQAVAKSLPGFATTTNPIDITAALLSNSGLFSEVLPCVAQDPAADMFFINIPVAGAGYDVQAFARDTAQFEALTGKPVAVAAWQASVSEPFRQAGVATFENEGDAVGVLGQLAAHTAMLRETITHWPALPTVDIQPGTEQYCDEAQSLALLSRHGVPVVEHVLCHSAEQVRAAFVKLGNNVALKGCSAEVPHKTEHALVTLGINNIDDAVSVFESHMAKLTLLNVKRAAVIVAAMSRGKHELMVGTRFDPVFGPVVLVGAGGKYVEAMKDYAVLLPPFSAEQVERALRGLRLAPMLDGVRGDAPMDVDAFSSIAVAVGKIAMAAGPNIASLDLNPVMVGSIGEGAKVVDALLERQG